MALVGLILPYMQFIGWLEINGLNLPMAVAEIMGSKLSLFAWLDVIIAVIVLVGFILFESKRLQMRMVYTYYCIVATLTIGVSFGLPLFLLLREFHMERVDIDKRVIKRK